MSRISLYLIVAICFVSCTGGSPSNSRHPRESAVKDGGGRLLIPAPDPASRDMFLSGRQPLLNVPQVVSVVNDGDQCEVTVKNIGSAPIGYYSAGASHIQLVQEVFDSAKWTLATWDWCGTGKSDQVLNPGESVVLVVMFWDHRKRERMLGQFWEPGTLRSSLVTLAAEPVGVR